MADQIQIADDDQLRGWQPSLRPDHRPPAGSQEQRIIAEEPVPRGVLGVLLAFLKRPFVRLVIGVGLFILAAIVYDNTLNFGSWTEREAARKPAEHKGADPVPLTPDD
jgi:hypothetical protein